MHLKCSRFYRNIPCTPGLLADIRFRPPFARLSRTMASKRKAEALSANDLKKPKKDASLTSFFGAPKVTPSKTSNGTVAPPAVKFDKEKWVASLKPEQKSLLKLEIDTLDPSWLAYLKDDITSASFLELKRFLQQEIDQGKKIFPPLEDVYSWYNLYPDETFFC